MNWKRYQILIITGGVCVVLSALLAYWMIRSHAANQELDMEIQGLSAEQARLSAQKIFPSQAGFDALKAAQSEVSTRRDKLAAVIKEGQVPVPPMMRAQFGDYIRRMVEQLRRDAAAAKTGGENGVLLVDPQFGLKSYLEGSLPEAGEIPALMVRMELLKHLTGLLFQSGISELISIEADKPVVETTAPALPGLPGMVGLPGMPGMPGMPSMPPPQFGGLPPPPGSTPVPARPEAEVQRERLFESVKFTIRFRVYEDMLWDLLNKLVADPNMIVVTRLRVENQNERLWPSFLRTDRPTPTTTTAPSPRRGAGLEALLAQVTGSELKEEESTTNLPGLSERRQLTTGGELLSVVLELTVYRLKAPLPATQTGS